MADWRQDGNRRVRGEVAEEALAVGGANDQQEPNEQQRSWRASAIDRYIGGE